MPAVSPADLDMTLRCVVGLDLGKLSDFSALAMLTWKVPPPQDLKPGWRADYSVPTLHRWALGSGYGDVIESVVKFFQARPLSRCARPLLVIDSTGVGEPVTEAAHEKLGRAGLRGGLVGVNITAGSAVTLRRSGRWNVAKKQLISTLQVLLGSRRLHVAPSLPEAATLMRELATFTAKVTESANEQFESWRERDHDDLVLAVALAAWAAESLCRARPRPPAPPQPQPRFIIPD
jgi:hypothetical protein